MINLLQHMNGKLVLSILSVHMQILIFIQLLQVKTLMVKK